MNQPDPTPAARSRHQTRTNHDHPTVDAHHPRITIHTSHLVLLCKERRPQVIATALAAALLGPLAWNAVLHRTRPAAFFVDIPFKPFPVSWQDTGSGVFTLAVASLFLGVLLRRSTAGVVVKLAGTVAIAAFLVDIYLH